MRPRPSTIFSRRARSRITLTNFLPNSGSFSIWLRASFRIRTVVFNPIGLLFLVFQTVDVSIHARPVHRERIGTQTDQHHDDVQDQEDETNVADDFSHCTASRITSATVTHAAKAIPKLKYLVRSTRRRL